MGWYFLDTSAEHEDVSRMSSSVVQAEAGHLVHASEWMPRKLHELGFVGRGRSRHRPRDDASLYGGLYPFIQTGDVKAAEMYLSTSSQTYNEKGLAQSKLWLPGTLCITIAANIAETAILSIPACFPDSIVGFVAEPAKADVRFVKYYIDSIKLRMQAISRGTTQDNLSLDKLLSFDIMTPPLPIQRKIAGILSAYDELIENNTRRIAILEEMARGLYHEWFVRFRFPGHESVRMVESALGAIPEGWRVERLGDVATVIMGQSPSSSFYNEAGEGLPFHQGVKDFGPRFPTDRVYCTVLDRIGEPADILLSVRAPVGRINIAAKRLIIGRGLCAIRSKVDSQAYLFQQLKEIFHEEDIMGNGAIFKAVTKNDVLAISVVQPPPDVIAAFEEAVRPMFRQLEVLTGQNKTLRCTRDLLLPELVSGEVDVADVRIDMGEAGA
jgi:type I restriction enzyme S subunit